MAWSPTPKCSRPPPGEMSQHLLFDEEAEDAVGRALVALKQLALALGGDALGNDDLLARGGGADGCGIEAEVGQTEGIQGLPLGGHDALHGGVARLVDGL